MEKQVKIRLYQNGISTGQEFLLNEENGWEHTVDNVPLFQDRNPVEYKVEEIEIGKTHYSSEYGDGFLYYEVIYPEIQYFDSNGQQLFPKDENEFKDVSKMELEVQNLHSILLNEFLRRMIFQETDLLVQVFCSTKYRMMMLRKNMRMIQDIQ